MNKLWFMNKLWLIRLADGGWFNVFETLDYFYEAVKLYLVPSVGSDPAKLNIKTSRKGDYAQITVYFNDDEKTVIKFTGYATLINQFNTEL